jgi:hypothetical protein
MSETERPHFFYLIPDGSDIRIVEMTDIQAKELWTKGQRWIDVGLKTKEEAVEGVIFTCTNAYAEQHNPSANRYNIPLKRKPGARPRLFRAWINPHLSLSA